MYEHHKKYKNIGGCTKFIFILLLLEVAYQGFYFGVGGLNFFGSSRLLGGFGGMLPEKILKNDAMWCVSENILLKCCQKKS